MDLSSAAIGCAIAFCGASAGSLAMRALSQRKNLLDRPNERSLHTVPVPRLGGVAIASAIWLALLTFHALRGSTPDKLEHAWLIISFPIAVLGLVDDLLSLPAGIRLLLQCAFAGLFCLAAGIPQGISLVAHSVIALPPALSLVLWSFFIVATLNIFNFMDGMDGLAGTQALGAALGIGGAFALSHQPSLAALCGLIGAASGGFLFNNFPPAKIFMGDAGSTFLGFSFAALAVVGANIKPAMPVTVFTLALAPFLLDGTFTLLRRAFRGDAFWKAHRMHLYQRAVTTGRSHHDVLNIYTLLIAVSTAAAICAADAGLGGFVGLSVYAAFVLLALLIWVRHLERVVSQGLNTPARFKGNLDQVDGGNVISKKLR